MVQQPVVPVELFPAEVPQHATADAHVGAELGLDPDGLAKGLGFGTLRDGPWIAETGTRPSTFVMPGNSFCIVPRYVL